MIRKDRHIHTPFCPHGTKDSLEKYVEKALSLEYTEISFTEHAPLPEGFEDTTPTRDSAMSWAEWDHYVAEIERVKQLYKGKIQINCGLEVDYIEGFEKEMTEALNKLGPRLDDAILSVHFLKHARRYDCVDYSPQGFKKMIAAYGSVEEIYKKYYETVQLSVEADLGAFKPRRIGHITLVHKFQNRFPFHGNEKDALIHLLKTIKKEGYELDYNGAGTRKPLCREPYPPNWVIQEAIKLQIPLVYGSDAHQAKELGQDAQHLLLHQ